MAKSNSSEHVVVLPDLHFPDQDRRSLNAVLDYIEATQPSQIIQIGDFMNFDVISDHNINKLKLVEGKRIKRDYDAGNEFLDSLQKRAKKAQVTILEGNHDWRIERYIEARPALEGMIEVPVGLHLDFRGIQWVPFWSKGETFKIGKATFAHGNYTNKYHAHKMVAAYGTNVFYGHTHDIQSYSLEYLGDDETRVGQSLGCLLNYDQGYMRGKPNSWQQAFGDFRFRSNGYFGYNVVRLFDHAFLAPDGTLYKG